MTPDERMEHLITMIRDLVATKAEIHEPPRGPSFHRLTRGDQVRHHSDKAVWVVTGNYGDRVTVVRSTDMTHPDEWEVYDTVTQQWGDLKP